MNSAVFTAAMRETMHKEYIRKYDAILVREHGRIDYKFFKDKQNRLYGYFKIPSETIEKFYYDVVVQFTGNEDTKEVGTNLFEYNVRFFSNDPAFTYTYAYVFNRNDLLIKSLRDKMSKTALKKAAVEKNPSNQVGYVKTLYFVYLTMLNKGLNHTANVEPGAVPLESIDTLKNLITDTDKKLGDREAAGVRLQRKKAREKQEEERRQDSNIRTDITLKVRNTTTIKKLNTANQKVTKTVSKVKRK
jgi:hypothetical protein